MTYATVVGQRSMALDDVRNAAYASALATLVTPDSVVLDLGAGTGILGLLAARAGARHVYLVEREDVIAVAGQVARANGLAERVTCLQGAVESVDVPEPVDLIVSAMTGNFLLAEDLLDVVVSARNRFLRPGGHLLPSAAVMTAVPVQAEALHALEVAGWSRARHGVDLSAARPYAANTIFFRTRTAGDARWLADPVDLTDFDLQTATRFAVHTEVATTVAEDGDCHGWLGWFRIQLGSEWLSTSPRDAPVHWSPAYLPVDPPIRVRRGEPIRLRLDREPHGDWTWQVSTEADRREHSTLFSAPLTTEILSRAAAGYRPTLGDSGRMMAAILEAADGTRTAVEIAEDVRQRFPAQAPTPADALRIVQAVIRRHA